MSFSIPESLSEHHDLGRFDCGEPLLNDWLRGRALQNQATGASRTFVISQNGVVIGYYALAATAMNASDAPGKFRRNMPNPIPTVLLGRLAIDGAWKGRGLGRALFRDAAKRISRAADEIGIRGMVVHAISASARDFYLALGFMPCPHEPLLLVITLQAIRNELA